MTRNVPPKSKNATSLPTRAKKASPPQQHVLTRWLTTSSSNVGKHVLHLMTEQAGGRGAVLDDVRAILRTHYVSPEIAANRLAALGAPATAKILRELLPRTKTARSGDLGEVLATEVAEQTLGFIVPIRRLRWKDGRNMALRGDDIVGIRMAAGGKIDFLKGESKSYATLTSAVIHEAGEALSRDRGRPGRHAVLFIATRLRESGNDSDALLAKQLEEAVIASFSSSAVEHFLFVLAGNEPSNFLKTHLTAAAKKKRLRHAAGVQISDHGNFIATLFGGL